MNNFWFKSNKPILALAPMAGFTDSAFREISKKYGADVVYSEMASASGLFYNPKKTLEILKFKKNERPYVVQLFGSNPEHFAKAALIITEKIKPDGIDINMGCPVKKVMKTGAGCALMSDYKLARKTIQAVCENTNLPVSVKIRAGYKNVNATDFIKKIKSLPFSSVMVHCRTYEQGFSGKSDYSLAAKIKKIIPDKIVLVNGGINSAKEAVKILKDYPSIDGFGIARGALGHPWLFEEIKDSLCHCERSEAISKLKSQNPRLLRSSALAGSLTMKDNYDFTKIKKILLGHAQLVQKNKGVQGLKEFRAHLGWYVRGFPGASELRRKLITAKSINAIKEILKY